MPEPLDGESVRDFSPLAGVMKLIHDEYRYRV
jgi:hypothetical protein